MATFDANVQAIAKEALEAGVIDVIHNSNILTRRVLSKTQAWRGTKMEKGIILNEAGNGGSFFGLDTFNTNAVNTKQKLSFDIRAYEQPVVIPQLEMDVVNTSPQRAVEYSAEAIQEAVNEMADNLGDIFYADGTGNSSKDFLGLAAIVDDGGEVATYGGLSRTTYSPLRATETDVGGALTLAVMATAFNGAKVGSDKPSIILTTESIWTDYEELAQPRININYDGYHQVGAGNALKGELGFDSLMYRGVPLVADEKATSGTMWFLNEKHLAFYRLKSTHKRYTDVSVGGKGEIEGEYANMSPYAGFDWSGFIDPDNQYGEVGHLLLLGQLLSFDPRKHAVLNTIS